jgi:molybdopterin biosynthesis enzyme
MVSFEQVSEILEREAQERAVAMNPERVTLAGAVGRVVAADLRGEPPTRAEEDVPVGESEPLLGDLILRQGETFTIANMVMGAELGVAEVVVSPRLSVGVIVVGDDAGGVLEPYASLLGLLAPDIGIVVSEVVKAAENSDEVTAQIERLVGLELDCLVVVSPRPDQLRSAVEAAGGWVLFDSPAVWPIGNSLFGTFRGRRSVVFGISSAVFSAMAAFRFLLGGYVARVAGARQRSPVKATLSHLIEKEIEQTDVVLGELIARRGEFLVSVIPSSTPFSFSSSGASRNRAAVEAIGRASCWVVLPAGRSLFDRGDLVDLYPLTPIIGRPPLVKTPEGESISIGS